MRRPGVALLAVTAGLLVFSAVYFLNPPAPRYYPVERAWRLTETGGVSMGWYGRSAWGLGAGLAAGALAGFLRRKKKDTLPLSRRAVQLSTLAVLLALAALMLHVLWHEFERWGVWPPH